MQKRNPGFAALAGAATLILAACDDGGGDEVAGTNFGAPLGAEGSDILIVYPAGTVASLELAHLRPEVERLRREAEGSAGETGAEKNSQDESARQAAQGAGIKAGGTAGSSRFSSLDRDGDGRLSPAECAIYDLPAETPARQGATDDQNPPFVSDEALNASAMSFRGLDSDGDFFLSAEEFERHAAARG